MKKILPIVTVLLLSVVIYLLYDRQQYRDGFNSSYQDKVAVLNSRIEKKFIENHKLRQAVDSINSILPQVDIKRESIKGDWREKIVEGKSKCDTVYLHSLDSMFLLSNDFSDTAILNRDLIIEDLEKIIKNDSLIINDKDSIVSATVDHVLDMEEHIKKEKRKNLVLKVGGSVLVVLTLIAIL
jgi:hypothetical protein